MAVAEVEVPLHKTILSLNQTFVLVAAGWMY